MSLGVFQDSGHEVQTTKTQSNFHLYLFGQINKYPAKDLIIGITVQVQCISMHESEL